MFEVDVKNVMEKGRRRRGPAWIWGSDLKMHSAWRRKGNIIANI